MYVCFKTLFFVVRHLDSTASYLPTGLHLGFFRSWPSLYLPSGYLFIYLFIHGLTARWWLKFNPKYAVHIILLYFNKCRVQWSDLYFIHCFVSRFSSNYPILSQPLPLLCPCSHFIQTASIMIKINVPYEFRNKRKVRGLQLH